MLRLNPSTRQAYGGSASEIRTAERTARCYFFAHRPYFETVSLGDKMGKTLDEIGLAAGTDKASHDHNYLNFYEKNLRHLRAEKFLLLEIGVYEGHSLFTWGSYFQAATVVGLDPDPAAKSKSTMPNTHVRIGNVGRLEVLDKLSKEFGAPLIIVDDGTHYWHSQIEALRYLWPRLRPGGVFIMEDVHTSFPAFAPTYENMSYSNISCYDYLQKLNRWLVGSRYMGAEKPDDGFIATYWPTVDYIQWYRGTCLIHKKSL